MQYIELRELLKGFTIFSLREIRSLDSSFHRRRLSEWQEKGYIRKVVRSYYVFSDLEMNESVLFEIANRIYAPSYISLEMALSYYHLIPESVYGVTSVSTRRTYTFRTPIAEFSYRTMKPALFFGYELVKYNGEVYKIASIEKAILDYLYLHPDINTPGDFAGLRIDRDMLFDQAKKERADEFLSRFDQKTLTGRFRTLWEFLVSDREGI